MKRRINFLFTPLESSAIYGRDERYNSLIPFKKAGVKVLSFLTGFIFVIILTAGVTFALAQDKPEITDKDTTKLVDKALIEEWRSLSPEERALLRERYQILKRMTPEERRRLKDNLDRFKRLPPDKQEMIRQRWQRIKDLSPEERQVIFKNYEKWRSLSPQERQRLRQRYKRIQQMSPEERKTFLEKQRRWQQMPIQEKQKLYQKYRKRKFSR